MEPTWPDCPHPQCDARNPPESLYCSRCGRPQYLSPGWQKHIREEASSDVAKSGEGAQVAIWIVVILLGVLFIGTINLFVRV